MMSSFGRVIALFGLCLGLVFVESDYPGVASDQLQCQWCTSAGWNRVSFRQACGLCENRHRAGSVPGRG